MPVERLNQIDNGKWKPSPTTSIQFYIIHGLSWIQTNKYEQFQTKHAHL